MSGWIDLGSVSEFPDGDMTPREVGDVPVIVVRRGSDFFVYEDRCTHIDYPLSTGFIDGNEIVCSWHGACFLVESGAVCGPPGDGPLIKVPFRIVDNRIQAKTA